MQIFVLNNLRYFINQCNNICKELIDIFEASCISLFETTEMYMNETR